MALDPMSPPDPEETAPREANPSELGGDYTPQGPQPTNELGDYRFWLRDGVTPYRSRGVNYEVFSKADDGWMLQQAINPFTMWEASPEEMAASVPGGTQRLTEERKGAMPPVRLQDIEDDLEEADSSADTDSGAGDGAPPELPSGGMSEDDIRRAGLAIDVPFEAASASPLKYKDTGQQAWTPPPGWRQGLPPIDADLAESLGVPRDLGATEGSEDVSTDSPGAA